MKRFVVYILGLCLAFAWGCTIKTPEVTFTSERTALEKQILGSYRTIEEDAWVISSVRSGETGDITIPESNRRVLEAFANRKYNADDVDDFKKDNVVGENNEGLLTIKPTKHYEEDPEYESLVDRIVGEENRDRAIIMARIVEINSAINPLDHEAVARVFAQMNQDASPKGTLIQQGDDSWVRK